MHNATLNQTLSTIHTFEDYEKLKQYIEKDLARAIIHKHQLSEAELTLFSDGTNPEYDLLGPGAFLIQGNKQLLREFLTAYGYLPHELTNRLSHQLTALMLLHQYSNLNIQVRIPNWRDRVDSLKDLENLVWGF